jgi:hypothetical protein
LLHLLQIDPIKRISIRDALNHKFFEEYEEEKIGLEEIKEELQEDNDFEITVEISPRKAIENELKEEIPVEKEALD